MSPALNLNLLKSTKRSCFSSGVLFVALTGATSRDEVASTALSPVLLFRRLKVSRPDRITKDPMHRYNITHFWSCDPRKACSVLAWPIALNSRQHRVVCVPYFV